MLYCSGDQKKCDEYKGVMHWGTTELFRKSTVAVHKTSDLL